MSDYMTKTYCCLTAELLLTETMKKIINQNKIFEKRVKLNIDILKINNMTKNKTKMLKLYNIIIV